ncbi:MAG TPA: polysaccharide deacetylase family protein [Gaiellales bacterium]|nr:polysaccharide deacetylase family protein [Gaiellales bacterium]
MPLRPAVVRVAYHAVGADWDSSLAIPEPTLRAQLRLLRESGYVGLTFAEAERRWQAGTLPRRTVVVTFDDGYASVGRALAALREVGYPATVFVLPPFVDSGAPMRWFGVEHEPPERMRPLRWNELASLREEGWEVGSHTLSHPLLTLVDDETLSRELTASREAIAARFGACATIAYPYGMADRRVAAAARKAGYQAGCSLTADHTCDTPYRRPRLPLTGTDTGLRLQLGLTAGLKLRRTPLVRAARSLRRSRPWLPAG